MATIVIASGKGGTGITTVAVNLALALALSGNKVRLLDCDVEEPNAHLFIKPKIDQVRQAGIPVPQIDYNSCNFCGYCSDICAFRALAVFSEHVMVLAELCHGCGSCSYLSPQKAIQEYNRPIGTVETGWSGDLFFGQGVLNPGEAMSPPLINEVKKLVCGNGITIIDAPPGTSCPVVTTVSGADYCILVTEPTPFGLHDLDLAVQMVEKIGIPAGVIINRSDLGNNAVSDYCRKNNLPVLLKIPFNRKIAELYARGRPFVLEKEEWQNRFSNLYRRVETELAGGNR